MPNNSRVQIMLTNSSVGLMYYGLAELSRHLASTPNSVTPVWPPDGLAVGVTLLYGNSLLPGVFLGSFLANVQAFSHSRELATLLLSIFAVLGIAAGTTLGTWLGTSLLRRTSQQRYPFNRVADVIKFLIYAGLLGPTVNATVGVAMLGVSQKIPWSDSHKVWPVWWISNVAGIFILTPLLLSFQNWLQSLSLRVKDRQLLARIWQNHKTDFQEKGAEILALWGLIFFLGGNVFWHHYPVAYMLIPLLIWAAFRFGHLGATLSMFIVSTIAILGTVRGLGIFAEPDLNKSLMGLQSFIAVVVFTTLILVAILSEQAQSRSRLRSAFRELQAMNERLERQTIQLSQNNQQLERTLQELKSTQAQMIQSEKMSALGNLIAGVAHEINNPLGFLTGSLSHIEEGIRDLLGHLKLYEQHYPNAVPAIQENAEEIDLNFLAGDLPQLVNAMKGATDRIRSISKSLGIFSRADTESKVSANLHEGFDSTLLILKYRLKANERRPAIQVIKEYGDLPEIECFPGQLNQVLMNLLANAIDALEEANAGRSFAEIQACPNIITLRTRIVGEKVEITIADNGVGMSSEVKAQVFDYLFTTKAAGKGTGLGLALARQIIEEKHSGTIEVNSELGRGTEFSLQLPLQSAKKALKGG